MRYGNLSKLYFNVKTRNLLVGYWWVKVQNGWDRSQRAWIKPGRSQTYKLRCPTLLAPVCPWQVDRAECSPRQSSFFSHFFSQLLLPLLSLSLTMHINHWLTEIVYFGSYMLGIFSFNSPNNFFFALQLNTDCQEEQIMSSFPLRPAWNALPPLVWTLQTSK